MHHAIRIDTNTFTTGRNIIPYFYPFHATTRRIFLQDIAAEFALPGLLRVSTLTQLISIVFAAVITFNTTDATHIGTREANRLSRDAQPYGKFGTERFEIKIFTKGSGDIGVPLVPTVVAHTLTQQAAANPNWYF